MDNHAVKANEQGLVRVFALSVPPEELALLTEENRVDWLAQTLGLARLNPSATLFRIEDLEDLGLIGYLIQGQGVPPTNLADDRTKLAALDGWVAVLPSSAFPTAGAALTLSPEATLIGTYAEHGVDWSADTPITTSSAASYSAPPAKPPMSEARISGMVATAVLLFLALFVVVFVWMAG